MQAQYRFIKNEDNNSFGVVVLPSANLPYMITANSEKKTKHHKYYEIDCELVPVTKTLNNRYQ